MSRRFFIHIGCLIIAASGVLMRSPAVGSEYLQLPGAIHVHSTFSSGKYSLPDLVAMAASSGVEVLALTDHDWVAMEYGLAPLRRLIRVRKELPSVLRTGVRDYLDQIHSLNVSQQDVLLLPGVQSSPFYYWTGNPLTDGLTAHDYRKELISIGMSSPEDYENLPVLHKAGFSGVSKIHLILWLGAVAILARGLWRNRPVKRHKLSLVVAGAVILLLINYHPFHSSGYDPYHGFRDEAPYQDYIDYVRSRGGMVFWSHPESAYEAAGRQLGPIQMKTASYADSLFKTRGYTGFAAIYGDTAKAHNPGMHWDETLLEHCAGFREQPAWAIAEADFHGNGEALDRYLTVFLVKEKTRPAILEAMAQGRMYAVIKEGTARPVLDDFRLTDHFTSGTAVSGQHLSSGFYPEISGRLSASDKRGYDTELLIIKNGKIMRVINERTPFEFCVRDAEQSPGKSVYRLEARMKKAGKIISNPIFVDCPGGITTAQNNV